MRDTYTRRRLLQVGGAASAGLGIGLAGCSGGTDDGSTTSGGDRTTSAGGEAGGVEELAAVPSGATFVASVDVATLLDSDVAAASVERGLSLAAEQQPGASLPQSYTDALGQVESALGADPRGLGTVTVFGSLSGSDTAETGAVLSTEWSESTLRSVLEQSSSASLSEQSYGETTLYVDAESSAVAVLGDGTYAFGERATVESIVDTHTGAAAAVDGAVVEAYTNAPDGPVRFGADLADLQMDGQSSPVTSVQRLSGGMTLDGSTAAMVVDARTTGSDAADQLQTVVENGLSLLKREFSDRPDVQAEFGEAIDQLDEIAVTREESTVSVDYSASTEAFASFFGVTLLAVVGTFVLGLGSTTQHPPQVLFESDYDERAGEVTITHAGGDTIQAGSLVVQTANRSDTWADLSEGHGVGDDVSAGDSVTLAVESDVTVRIVYDDGEQRAMLSTFELQ